MLQIGLIMTESFLIQFRKSALGEPEYVVLEQNE